MTGPGCYGLNVVCPQDQVLKARFPLAGPRNFISYSILNPHLAGGSRLLGNGSLAVSLFLVHHDIKWLLHMILPPWATCQDAVSIKPSQTKPPPPKLTTTQGYGHGS